jgi:hypothetical protein
MAFAVDGVSYVMAAETSTAKIPAATINKVAPDSTVELVCAFAPDYLDWSP